MPVERHDLKTWPKWFEQVFGGVKVFEVRRDDRNFQQGDYVNLREWNPETELYTGRECHAQITYVLRGAAGVEPGYCVLGLFVFHCTTKAAPQVEERE